MSFGREKSLKQPLLHRVVPQRVLTAQAPLNKKCHRFLERGGFGTG